VGKENRVTLAPASGGCYVSIMSMSFEIPAEIQNRVEGIPDLEARVALFLRHEAALESLRQQRFRPAARALAARALLAAEQTKDAGFEWSETFSALRAQLQSVAQKP
jgi:hypothetical protein